ncbi:MAG: YqaA family protein [Dongiaceae bacterium]
MLRRLYDWMLVLSGSRRAMPALAAVAFAESSFFPIPPDVMIIPMVLAQRAKAWGIAALATVGSALGGVAGYAIGYFLFESVGRPILDFYGADAQFAQFQSYYNEWGAWIVAAAGFTPIPYKVFTIASGVTHLDLLTFVVASVLSRGARFFLVAALLWKFGPPIRTFVENNLPLLAWLLFGLALAGFLAVRYIL